MGLQRVGHDLTTKWQYLSPGGRGRDIIIESISLGYWDAKGIQRRNSYTRLSKEGLGSWSALQRRCLKEGVRGRQDGWGGVRKNSVCKKAPPESSKCTGKGTVA